MRKTLAILATILASAIGCRNQQIPPAPAPTPVIAEIKTQETIKILTWNIQAFGEAKRNKPEVMQKIVDIIEEFPITAIQEIRDAKEETIPYLLSQLNQGNDRFRAITSTRLGRTNSKEQYVFVYDRTKITTGTNYVYDDKQDKFEREPFIAYFKAGNFNFVLVNIHTKPTDAKKEIASLEDVIMEAQKIDPDVITLGDYNADGTYYSEEDQSQPLRAPKYIWAIGNEVDTTVAQSSNTYDRVIFLQSTQTDWTGKTAVIRFDELYGLTPDEAKTVSDHYPVWIEFYTNKDQD